ncbi:MAG: bifunctional demethylmenaquinone methyltransferase/2-methoxy-6-polyprenyl-1,4-benzoquinol methylase UbiE [Planctomycetaceae bacterium]|jgi:demethylmenaquinone methyltransferase/2-methoxy-6-polyprenyl-1,4-benzoquinol methylase|nr:bifunctional demethylmenaquinone methyltransferase/2-methoxy-6-polyprenyl-1,4-benzoquinol methylase UbiE [Planctomycetaceae bacterium]
MQTKPFTDKSPEKIRRMFDSIAPWYDFLNHFFSLGIDRYWRRAAVKRILSETIPEGSILDVCCGTGDLTLEFLKQTKNREYYGIDFSPEMVNIGLRKIERYKNNGIPVRLMVGDALNLPFESGSFSIVAVAFGLRNVGNTERGLREMFRVCKQDGTIAVLEFSMPERPILSTAYRFYFRSILPRIGQFLARNQSNAYHYLPESVLTFDKPKELVQRLQLLGITNIQTQPLTFGIATLIWGQKNANHSAN